MQTVADRSAAHRCVLCTLSGGLHPGRGVLRALLHSPPCSTGLLLRGSALRSSCIQQVGRILLATSRWVCQWQFRGSASARGCVVYLLAHACVRRRFGGGVLWGVHLGHFLRFRTGYRLVALAMGKRALGIPHGDQLTWSRRTRAAALGLGLPAACSSQRHAQEPSQDQGRVPPSPGQQARIDNPHRTDAPVLRPGVRAGRKGSRPSDGPVDVGAALSSYERDKYAGSAQASRASLANTWMEYHRKAAARGMADVPPELFPVTVPIIRGIASLMKLDGFRSFANYASWAKCVHISKGFEWTQQLAQELKQAGRSLDRGLGPARQSAAFELEQVAAIAEIQTRSGGLPVLPRVAVLLGSLWVLREIEMAWAVWGDIVMDDVGLTVAWTLSASKTDPGAKSCVRQWGCMCSEIGVRLCPYHVFAAYRASLAVICEGSVDPFAEAKPVFPCGGGKVVAKAAMVAGIETVMQAIGSPCMDTAGRRLFGGHSCRVAGSRFWVSKGLEVFKLQVFARWGSSVILRYIADAPLAALSLPRQEGGAPRAGERSGTSSSRGDSVSGKIGKKLEDFTAGALAEFEDLRKTLRDIELVACPQFVLNPASGVWHRVLVAGLHVPPSRWSTHCGWKFAMAELHTLEASVPLDAVHCRSCFREIRRCGDGIGREAGSDSSESSS